MSNDSVDTMMEQLTPERKDEELVCASLEERDEQLDALLRIIYLLSRSVTNTKYFDTDEADNGHTEEEEAFSLNYIYKELDGMSSDWNLEETALPVLISEINKVQSNMHVVSKEIELAESENQHLKTTLGKSQELNAVLKKICKGLYRENMELKKSIVKKVKAKESLKKGLRDLSFMSKEKEEANEIETFKLKTALHEQNLRALCEDHDDNMSCISTLTSHSTIYDDGMATVCLFPEQKSPRTAAKKRGKVLKITIKSNKLGLQFLMIPDKYAGDELKDASMNDEVGLFVVCGYHGFDDKLNIRPDLGSKLIAINYVSLERTMHTTKDLHQQINSKLTSTKDFTLSFRNDELTKMQRDVLNKAITATNESSCSIASTGIFNISFRKSEKGSVSSTVRELSPLAANEQEQILDSEDRDNPLMEEPDDNDDQNSVLEHEIILKDLDAIYKNNINDNNNVLDSPRSLCTDSICGDTNNITVLRDWSSAVSPLPSTPVVQQDGTPVLREWGSSSFTEKNPTPQEENKNDQVKQNPKKIKIKKRFGLF